MMAKAPETKAWVCVKHGLGEVDYEDANKPECQCSRYHEPLISLPETVAFIRADYCKGMCMHERCRTARKLADALEGKR